MTVALQAPQWYWSDMVASENYFGAEPIWKTSPDGNDIFIWFIWHYRAKEITKVKSIRRVVEMIYWVTYGTCDYGVDIQGIARDSRSSHRLGPSHPLDAGVVMRILVLCSCVNILNVKELEVKQIKNVWCGILKCDFGFWDQTCEGSIWVYVCVFTW